MTVISESTSREFLSKYGIDGEGIYTSGHSDDSISLLLDSGEQVTGFLDKKTGEITEISLIQSDKDLEQFKRTYGVEEDIKKVN